jgi:hypothetical protein
MISDLTTHTRSRFGLFLCNHAPNRPAEAIDLDSIAVAATIAACISSRSARLQQFSADKALQGGKPLERRLWATAAFRANRSRSFSSKERHSPATAPTTLQNCSLFKKALPLPDSSTASLNFIAQNADQAENVLRRLEAFGCCAPASGIFRIWKAANGPRHY